MQGKVKSWNGAKGFGFIACPMLPGTDVFFAKEMLPDEMKQLHGRFLENRPVTFSSQAGPDGRQKATAVQVGLVEGMPLAGQIKSFSSKNGYGFLTSTAVAEDVRFFKTDLPVDPGENHLKGEFVTFEVQAQPDGKLRASKLQFQSQDVAQRLQGGMMGMGMMTGMMGKGGNAGGAAGKGGKATNGGMQMGGAQQQQALMMSQMSGLMTGTVKSFSDKNFYGFINMPGYPVDIKFGKKELVNCESVSSGETVSFKLSYGPDGRMVADQVSSLGGGKGNGGMKRPAAMMASSAQFGFQPQKQPRTQETGTGQFTSGAVKSYNPTKGFGFIGSANFSEDVFFMKSSLPAEAQSNIMPGQNVMFEIAQTTDGKVRALNVSMM